MKEVGIAISPVEIGRVPKLEDCDAGLSPHDMNVVCAMQLPEAKTAGGVILTAQTQQTEGMASQLAMLVAASPLSWTEAKEIGAPVPKVGDVVVIGRYAGVLVQGRDGKDYRILKDRDVAGVVEVSQ